MICALWSQPSQATNPTRTHVEYVYVSTASLYSLQSKYLFSVVSKQHIHPQLCSGPVWSALFAVQDS